MEHKVNLSQFDAKNGLNRGKSKVYEALWYLIKMIFFLSPFPWPNFLKAGLLRMFGAKIGRGLVIKPRVNIHFPWKLEIGDHVWLGEEVFILNFEKVIVNSHVCISQRAFLCGGNHDFRDYAFRYRNGLITLEEGSWIGAQSFVAPDTTIGKYCVITAGSVVVGNLPGGKVCSGNPCKPVKERWKNK